MAMTRITYRGKRMNTRTRDMLLAAEKILGYQFNVIQGSYNAGGVAASAGTHDGGGALDVWGKGGSRVATEVAALRRVGFAAWGRTPSQGPWGYHIHAIAIGDADLSSGARAQVTEYLNGYNGLAGNGRDTFTRTYAKKGYTWEDYKATITPPKPQLTFHTLSINAGAQGMALSPWTKNEVEKFLSYCVQTGALTPAARSPWFTYVSKKDWKRAGAIVLQAVKNVQKKGRLTVDGIFGNQTGRYVDSSSIANVILNGTNPPRPKISFHTLSVKAGAKGLALSPWTKTEVETFLSYCVQTGALTAANRNSWLNVVKTKNWAHAGEIVTQAVKNVQHKGGLTVDGICGPQTAAYISKSAIANCIVNG